MAANQEDISRRMWESENSIENVGTIQEIYGIDFDDQEKVLLEAPWIENPEYLRYVKISAVALLKMIMHARIKDQIEVCGYLEGKVSGNSIILIDTCCKPHDVSTTAQGHHIYTYFAAQKISKQRRHRVAWYRSQPHYGCWLPESVFEKQAERQEHRSFLLVVIMIDPIKTITAGKVCLSAFRLYPTDYTPKREVLVKQPYLPEKLKKEFLKNCKNYYPLEVTYFKTAFQNFLLKYLWNEYWIQSLGSSGYLVKSEALNKRILNVTESLELATDLMDQIAHNDEPDSRQKTADQILNEATAESSEFVTETLIDTAKDLHKFKLFSNLLPK